MKKKIFIFCIALVLSFSIFNIVHAQDQGVAPGQAANINTQETFKAKVIEILQEKEVTEPGDTEPSKIRSLELIGTSGSYENKKFEVDTTNSPDELVRTDYKVGDNVLVMYSVDNQGNGMYTITDYVRTNVIVWLFVAFVLAVIAVGKFKGVRSIVSLVVTFLIMIKYIVPQILAGADPVVVTVIGSIAILISIIYLTEGFNMKSHIAALSITICLIFTIALSWFLVGVAKLSGLNSDEASYIVNLGVHALSLKGILLAGIIIGTLGALNDIVVSQVATVEEIVAADPYQSKTQVLTKAFNVGISHISALTNTLFLAYAGAALPLLILLVSGQNSFGSWDVAINNEMLATEIIRTLAGTIGIVLSVPIVNFISVWWFKKNKLRKN